MPTQEIQFVEVLEIGKWAVCVLRLLTPSATSQGDQYIDRVQIGHLALDAIKAMIATWNGFAEIYSYDKNLYTLNESTVLYWDMYYYHFRYCF